MTATMTTTTSLFNASNLPANLTTQSLYGYTDIYSSLLLQRYLVFRFVFYSFATLLGLFGNAMTVFIIHRFRSNWSPMDRYFLSLAVTDLCVVITGPFRLWIRFATGFHLVRSHDVFCKIVAYVYNTAIASSVWILATMATHRALMVHWPHRVNAICTPRHTWTAVIVIAVFSCLANSHMLYGVRLIPRGGVCGATGKYLTFLTQTWLYVEFFLHSFLPMMCISVGSIVMVRKLRVSERETSDQLAPSDAQVATRAKMVNSVTLQTVVVSMAFMILTLPVAVWNATSYLKVSNEITDLYQYVLNTVIQGSLYNLGEANFCVNFYLYCLTGSKFRNELKRVLCRFQRKTLN